MRPKKLESLSSFTKRIYPGIRCLFLIIPVALVGCGDRNVDVVEKLEVLENSGAIA